MFQYVCRRDYRTRSGFTLIELLVVVAIIALLISILLPSLGQARAQARTSLCNSRISQLCKALILYANDYEETPPFLGLGYENLGKHLDYTAPGNLGMTNRFWAEHEKWLIPRIPTIWDRNEADWESLTNGEAKVRNGLLFNYAKFETLYRCPEFERIQNKEQNAFNYTRSILGRRTLSGIIDEDRIAFGLEPKTLRPGPIMKMSALWAPASMFMLFDEQWDFHVASNYNGDPEKGIIKLKDQWFWMGADSIHAILADGFGDYHGSKGKDIQNNLINESRYSSTACYDGHVEMLRDPMPGRNLELTDLGSVGSLVGEATKLFAPFLRQVFAQRGYDVNVMAIVNAFLGSG